MVFGITIFSLFYTRCQIHVQEIKLVLLTFCQNLFIILLVKSFIKDHLKDNLVQHTRERHLFRTLYCTRTFVWWMKTWGCGFDLFYHRTAGWATQSHVHLFILYQYEDSLWCLVTGLHHREGAVEEKRTSYVNWPSLNNTETRVRIMLTVNRRSCSLQTDQTWPQPTWKQHLKVEVHTGRD